MTYPNSRPRGSSRPASRAGPGLRPAPGAAVVLLAGISAVTATATAADLDRNRDRDFNPRRVVPPIRPITDARSIPAAEVVDQVTAPELVLGVAVGGEARAYPINMLTGPRREIINDTLGGRPIAATW